MGMSSSSLRSCADFGACVASSISALYLLPSTRNTSTGSIEREMEPTRKKSVGVGVNQTLNSAARRVGPMADDETDVLEFSLGDGRYCIDIAHVDEIVDANEDVTPIPNSDAHVVGVVDLRGETTTVVDPRVKLGEAGETEGSRIVVLSEHDATGLLVDDVHEVEAVAEDDLDDSAASGTTRGVVRRDDRFVVWVDPDALV